MKNPQRVFWLIQNWEFVEKDGSSFYEQVFFGKEIVFSGKGKFLHYLKMIQNFTAGMP